MKNFFYSLTTWIMILTCAFTVAAIWFIPALYKQVVEKSNVSIQVDTSGVVITSEQPMWFRVDSTKISTNKALEISDIKELQSLVCDTCSTYPMYVNAIGKLAYQSNNDTSNLNDLILLTLSFVMLGCSARTLYDFIGRRCYKKKQDMSVWWPWYVFRPIICAPIAALLLVSVRTSFFSNLFVAKDLNSYLVVSFIAGFAIMEFLTMLRRLSKSLFDVSESKSSDSNKTPPTGE